MLSGMKKVIAVILVFFSQLLIFPAISAADSVPDEQFILESALSSGANDKIGVNFQDDKYSFPTMLYSYEIVNNFQETISFCNGLDDAACASASYMRYNALMPPCKSSADFDCIESIYAIEPGKPTRIEGIYKESIPEEVGHPYKADPARGLPQGSLSGVWEIPGIKHGGGSTTFAAIVSRTGSLERNGTTWRQLDKANFSAGIYPVIIVRDARYQTGVVEFSTNNGHSSVSAANILSNSEYGKCAIFGNGVCGLRQSFPDDIQFGMVIRFSNVINGWMHGRINSPEIDYELTDYGTRVDMKGLATRVPIAAGRANASDFTEKELNTWNLSGNRAAIIQPEPSGIGSMAFLNRWAGFLNDKAAANPSQWNFYNLPVDQMNAASSCIKSSKTLAGFVTTNSTTYAGSPPIFNKKTGTLDYKVASLHYLPDGKVFQGKYTLYIDSKVARCIYKFSNAPISAKVSITSADGEEQSIATTSLNERNGWIQLSAIGFTFSSPTIKVKLMQEKSKKNTITCSKGMTSKKVSAISPKCPKGFTKV
jgi:hypothetical protein